ncbi:sensor histidine kinase [Aquimarina sp. 2201CG5-10]|uniref:sensor histidine kinase n=1 Tax=Aquimarina callyspongiae TaxID=3098150 RepID=UPI002AB476E5|nr:sensor histidine kinase [Aquimarina sp. 2201CG5-10]MDY8135496.1 sensor histidine kinase [Aquimarina sp. 2201CG5-10]
MKTHMASLIKSSYKKLIIGGILTSSIFIVGSLSGGFVVRPDAVILPLYIVINVFSFLFCWLTLTLIISKFPIYKILGVFGLLFLGAVVEYYMNIPDNPITIPLLILFWMGISYFVIPRFFKRHQIAILFTYGTVITYFFIFRGRPNYAEDYRPVVTNFLIISISMMIILWAYDRWKWLTTLRADKAKAELMLLKNQINPHFFFNTLNNLYGLVVEKSEEAPAMILKLSDIMRYTIYDGKADYVHLKDEISYIEDYIELHKIRYQKKVEITFKKDISHSHKIAPVLLVVPLENAFKHGVESLMENAFIRIEISTTNSSIFFKIRNNYEFTGLKNNGIGLDNLQKRLMMIYPNKHKLEITKPEGIYELSLSIETT